MPLKLTTYYRGKDIPDLPGTNTFHSKELFQIYESTPGYTPLLIVATEEGRPVARLLAAIRKTKKWLPSSLVKQCVVYGAGEFLDTSLPASKEKEEEIFGEIEDEHDTTSYIAKSVGDNEYILSGRLEIEKANELFSLGLPENDDYQTIGGLILHQYQSFPKIHEEITFDKFHFKIIKVTATKIELVKLKVTE